MDAITTSPARDSFGPPLVSQPEVRARSLYNELRAEGLTERDMMTLVGELMGLVTDEMRSHSEG
jgi:hypothetical protein